MQPKKIEQIGQICSFSVDFIWEFSIVPVTFGTRRGPDACAEGCLSG